MSGTRGMPRVPLRMTAGGGGAAWNQGVSNCRKRLQDSLRRATSGQDVGDCQEQDQQGPADRAEVGMACWITTMPVGSLGSTVFGSFELTTPVKVSTKAWLAIG